MTFLDRLERTFSRFAIPSLIRYVVMLNAGVFLLNLLQPGVIQALDLDSALIKQGQYWRLITWLFIPNTMSLLWIFFFLAFTWWTGDCLEAAWGTFRLNLYYLLGWAGCTLAAFLYPGMSPGNMLLSFSLLLAFATLAPNQEILFFFFPLKLKWVALMSLVYPWGLLFVSGGPTIQKMIIVCLLNYLLFFGPYLVREFRNTQRVTVRRAKFEAAKATDETLHRCRVCGLTEISDPHADFRVAADGEEYCSKHLPGAGTPL